jgi:hypothetical protein
MKRMIGLIAGVLALSACGSSNDEAASSSTSADVNSAASTESTPATTTTSTIKPTATTTTAAVPTTDAAPVTEPVDDTIVVNNLSEMPPECVDLMSEFLILIEPTVSVIDWTSATLGDFQDLAGGLQPEFTQLDERESAAGCDQYDFADDAASSAAILEVAEASAPGTVGWLNAIAKLSGPTDSESGDGPADCDGAIAYIQALIDQQLTMMDVRLSDYSTVMQTVGVISSECPAAQADSFLASEGFSRFSSVG